MRQSRKPTWMENIAKERIEILFSLANKELKPHPERSRRYVQLARKIGLRYNVRLSKERKRQFCKYCNTLLKSSNTKTELDKRNNLKIVICLNCKKPARHLINNKLKNILIPIDVV